MSTTRSSEQSQGQLCKIKALAYPRIWRQRLINLRSCHLFKLTKQFGPSSCIRDPFSFPIQKVFHKGKFLECWSKFRKGSSARPSVTRIRKGHSTCPSKNKNKRKITKESLYMTHSKHEKKMRCFATTKNNCFWIASVENRKQNKTTKGCITKVCKNKIV